MYKYLHKKVKKKNQLGVDFLKLFTCYLSISLTNSANQLYTKLIVKNTQFYQYLFFFVFVNTLVNLMKILSIK